jgi:hypothetical protein
LFLAQITTPAQVVEKQPEGQVSVEVSGVAAAFFCVFACLRAFFLPLFFLSDLTAGAACVEACWADACGAAGVAAVSAAQAGRVNIKALNNSMYFMVMFSFWLKKHSRFSCTYELLHHPSQKSAGKPF